MALRKCTKLWTTGDGTKIRICDMTDKHLNNTVAYIERAAEAKLNSDIAHGYSVLGFVQGEMAEIQIENQIRHLEESGIEPDEISPLYSDMLLERIRRDIEKREQEAA